MAGLKLKLRALQNDPNLGQFILRDVRPTGRQLGVGSYGSVEEIEFGGLVCAGKTIHEALLDAEKFGAGNISQKYIQECQLMAGLRHPNITQFLGLCFLPPATLPVLVTEKLEGSLDDLLETTPNIPLALKRSILEDVARGLLYLHRRDPPIIHRDLTARNVLLTSSFAAKITDLGNSRIVNLQPGQLARSLTQMPGTLAYMPPEAMSMASQYGPSLDIFSFGHLGLFTGVQKFPGDLLGHTFVDPDNPERLVARSEVERRGVYFEQLENSLLRGEQHPFVRLVKQCLHNTPSQRPTTDVLLRNLKEMTTEIKGPDDLYDVMKQGWMSRLMQSESEVKRKDRKIRRLQQELEQTQERLRNKTMELTRLNQAQGDRDRVDANPLFSHHFTRSTLPQLTLQVTAHPTLCDLNATTPEGTDDGQSGDYSEDVHWAKGKRIGSGSFCVCYLASDFKNGTMFAVKQVRLDRNTKKEEEELRDRIDKEISTMRTMDHPNILRYLGHVFYEKEMYVNIFTEWMPSGCLDQQLELIGRPFAESVIVKYTRQITNGTVYLHNNGIIHRDLKGNNILCDSTGHTIRIADFGACATLAGHTTGTGEFKKMAGTVVFMAPEVVREGRNQCNEVTGYGRKCDVWSIGCVIIQMATGKLPWIGTNNEGLEDFQLVYKIAGTKNPPPLPVFSNPSLKDFTFRCLKLKPEDRPTSSELLNHQLIADKDELP